MCFNCPSHDSKSSWRPTYRKMLLFLKGRQGNSWQHLRNASRISFPFNLTFEPQFLSNSKINHYPGWGAPRCYCRHLNAPVSSLREPHISLTSLPAVSWLPTGNSCPGYLLPSVLEINCRARFVFPYSCCLLCLVFQQAGAAWSAAAVCDNKHSQSGKVAGGKRGSCHPLAITLVQGAPSGTSRTLVDMGVGNTRPPHWHHYSWQPTAHS